MASSIFVRPDGEADVVARGPGGTLVYYWAAPGSGWRGSDWQSVHVAGPGTTVSAPSLFVGADGRAHIAAQGRDASLLYYWAEPASGWNSVQVAGPRTTYSAPSVCVRPDGQVDVVARGPDFSLLYYWAAPGSGWNTVQVAGPGTTGYIPSVFVRPDGQLDIAAQGPDASLLYYWAEPGSEWNSVQVAGPRTTFSAPSVYVRPDGQADVVAVGPGGTLVYHWAAPGAGSPGSGSPGSGLSGSGSPGSGLSGSGSPGSGLSGSGSPGSGLSGSGSPGSAWQSVQVAPADEAMSSVAPSIFVRPGGEADITAVGPRGALKYYWAAPGAGRHGSEWQSVQVDAVERPFVGASLFVRPDGEADIAAWGPGDILMYYLASLGSQGRPWRVTRLNPAGG